MFYKLSLTKEATSSVKFPDETWLDSEVIMFRDKWRVTQTDYVFRRTDSQRQTWNILLPSSCDTKSWRGIVFMDIWPYHTSTIPIKSLSRCSNPSDLIIYKSSYTKISIHVVQCFLFWNFILKFITAIMSLFYLLF